MAPSEFRVNGKFQKQEMSKNVRNCDKCLVFLKKRRSLLKVRLRRNFELSEGRNVNIRCNITLNLFISCTIRKIILLMRRNTVIESTWIHSKSSSSYSYCSLYRHPFQLISPSDSIPSQSYGMQQRFEF